jgi:hypothetical protein
VLGRASGAPSSYKRAGSHLRSIWGEESRLDAEAVSVELAGVQVLDLATVTRRGELRVAPVDGLFFRGAFWFGSAENSVRVRNIRANPSVSAAVTRGLETFLVIVHGRAIEIDPRGPDAGALGHLACRVTSMEGEETCPLPEDAAAASSEAHANDAERSP